jgi:hypothetical protein
MSHPGIRLCCSSLVNYFGNGVIQSLDYIRYLPGAYRPGSPNDAVIQWSKQDQGQPKVTQEQ